MVLERKLSPFILMMLLLLLVLSVLLMMNQHINFAILDDAALNSRYLTMVDFVRNQCNTRDHFFAAAGNDNGKTLEFCKMADGTIGVLIYERGKPVTAKVVTLDNYYDLLDFIRQEGCEINWYRQGYIPLK